MAEERYEAENLGSVGNEGSITNSAGNVGRDQIGTQINYPPRSLNRKQDCHRQLFLEEVSNEVKGRLRQSLRNRLDAFINIDKKNNPNR